MRRALLVALAATVAAVQPLTAAESCAADGDTVVCTVSGDTTITTPGTPGSPDTPIADRPSRPRPPLRYLGLGTNPGGERCFYWSSVSGIDAWDNANDAAIITITTTTPRCRTTPTPTRPGGPTAVDVAWEVYRSWDLPAPTIAFSPPDGGITGFETYLGAEAVTPLNHTETLPSGDTLQVEALITAVEVDWGDGTVVPHALDDLSGYPTGTAIHVYSQKTCPPDYRATHPSGHLCHPALDAYPVTVTYAWTARYRVGGPWIELESVRLATTLPYDVDEVVGVLEG